MRYVQQTPTRHELVPGVSVVVPVYNGAGSIEELARQVEVALSPQRNRELIFVVDGSSDNTNASSSVLRCALATR